MKKSTQTTEMNHSLRLLKPSLVDLKAVFKGLVISELTAVTTLGNTSLITFWEKRVFLKSCKVECFKTGPTVNRHYPRRNL